MRERVMTVFNLAMVGGVERDVEQMNEKSRHLGEARDGCIDYLEAIATLGLSGEMFCQ